MNELPPELITHIITFLFPSKECDFDKFIKLRCVSTLFKDIIDDAYMLGKYITYLNEKNILVIENEFFDIHNHISPICNYFILFKKIMNQHLKPCILHTMSSSFSSIEEFVSIPVCYDLQNTCTSITKDKEYEILKENKIYSSIPLCRGLNNEGKPFLCIRLFDRIKQHYKIEYLYYDTNNDWKFYNNPEERSYIGILGTNYTETFKNEMSHIRSNPDRLTQISYNYLKRLLQGEKCGIPVKRWYMMLQSIFNQRVEVPVTYYVEGFEDDVYFEYTIDEHKEKMGESLIKMK